MKNLRHLHDVRGRDGFGSRRRRQPRHHRVAARKRPPDGPAACSLT